MSSAVKSAKRHAEIAVASSVNALYHRYHQDPRAFVLGRFSNAGPSCACTQCSVGTRIRNPCSIGRHLMRIIEIFIAVSAKTDVAREGLPPRRSRRSGRHEFIRRFPFVN